MGTEFLQLNVDTIFLIVYLPSWVTPYWSNDRYRPVLYCFPSDGIPVFGRTRKRLSIEVIHFRADVDGEVDRFHFTTHRIVEDGNSVFDTSKEVFVTLRGKEY
jgi:hypothetical protein